MHTHPTHQSYHHQQLRNYGNEAHHKNDLAEGAIKTYTTLMNKFSPLIGERPYIIKDAESFSISISAY